MFEKLLSLLPYNPGLSHHMAFYSKRMREEASIRRTGLVFIVLAFFIQFFAVISPPQPTVADSSNDLVNGGISSAADAAQHCRDNVRDYGTILHYYGISCKEVANAPTMTIHATDHDKKLMSMGHLPYGKPGETPVRIGGETLYWRYLWGWPYGTQGIKVLRILSHGKTFYIMYDCGNLVSIGLPQAPKMCEYNKNLAADSPDCFKPCKYDKDLPATSSRCFAPCPIPGKSGIPQNSNLCVAPCPYNKKLSAGSPQCFPPCQYNKNIAANSTECFPPCQYNSSISASDSECKPCTESLSSQDTTACVVVSKTAANLTQNIGNADGTTAHAGDTIVYTLYAKNSGKATVKKYVFQENLSDVLDYADVVDPHGGKLDSDGNISWPAKDIAAGATASEQVTVKVKDPIPATPTSSSDPGHFDMIMTNVYGNTVNINLPPSPTQTVETTAASLPNTGPGTTLLIAAVIMAAAGYFYARAGLLARESRLALKEMA